MLEGSLTVSLGPHMAHKLKLRFFFSCKFRENQELLINSINFIQVIKLLLLLYFVVLFIFAQFKKIFFLYVNYQCVHRQIIQPAAC